MYRGLRSVHSEFVLGSLVRSSRREASSQLLNCRSLSVMVHCPLSDRSPVLPEWSEPTALPWPKKKAIEASDELFGDILDCPHADESLLGAAFEPDPWDEEDPWANETCCCPPSVRAEVDQGSPQADGSKVSQVSSVAPPSTPRVV